MSGLTADRIAAVRQAPPQPAPEVERIARGSPEEQVNSFIKRGYMPIGSSSFNSGERQSEDAAIRQGAEVGADLVVIIDPKYTGTVTSSIPISAPTSSTTYYSGSATTYGSGGYARASSNGTATTFGTTTSLIPISVNRVDYAAWYFIKRKPARFGAVVRDLDKSQREELQSNKGVSAVVIVDNSPAFDADILVGDMIIEMDGESVANVQRYEAILAARPGKLVEITLVRRGQQIKKSVQLRS
jgi:hypothetical protein